MAHWLCAARNGQEHDHIQRFDPRFWTVNFPRPMMASVVTIAPDALRLTCEFHHAGELAGLIWESEDRLDHPLHRYATDRDRGSLERQFERDKEELRDLGVPLETFDAQGAENDTKFQRYRIPADRYQLPDEVRFTPDQYALLGLAAQGALAKRVGQGRTRETRQSKGGHPRAIPTNPLAYHDL